MQKTVSQILEGKFDHEKGSLDFSCTKIELSLKKGESFEGAFRIRSEEGRFTDGRVISSDLRMECLTDEFVGCDEEIRFCFHGENLEAGDVVKGNFYVISNHGEYYLPFVVSVEHIVLESSVGVIRNLFHFANLAKSNWQEALRLFYSPEFYPVFDGSDAQFAEDYRALSVYEGSEQNMEEFLIRINKKQKVEYLAQEDGILLETARPADAYAVLEKELNVVRNGWGYTRLCVECEGEFLFTEKEVLTDDDFLGNRCTLPVFIDSSRCRDGRNFGRIFLYNSYVSLEIPVTVRIGEGASARTRDITGKRCTVQLMEFYQAFRTKKISTGTWLKETKALVGKLVALNENDIAARLFQAQLLITEDSCNEAGWILDHAAGLLEKYGGDETLHAYYLYLTTLIHREEKYVNRVAAEVEHIYRKDQTNWRVAWLLLYLSEKYQKSAADKWSFLEEQFAIGCSSPILYIEAVSLLNMNPALLRRLGNFERQVIRYGIRQELLKAEVTEQFLYLVEKVRSYSGLLYRCLVSLYEKKKDVRILQQICTILIKGNRVGEDCFAWYRLGVENNLRITNLYEYYMLSLNPDKAQEIPREILLYFSYQNSLDYERTAYLYDYILQNEDRLGELCETCRSRMEYFCVDQIMKLHINRHLANLYRRLLQPGMITEQLAEPLSRLLFAHRICVEDDRICRVFVYQPGNLYPAEYRLTDGRAWISLYGSRYTIVLEDACQNRFLKTVDYTLEKLMLPGKYLRTLADLPTDNPELTLYLCESGREEAEKDREWLQRLRKVADSDYVEDTVKRELTMLLVQGYYEMEDERLLNGYLAQIDPEMLTAEERGTLVRYAMLRGNRELAGRWLTRYGPYFMDAKLLVRLIGPMMEEKYMLEDAVLKASALYVFQKGKYDGTVLRYLTLYAEGMTKNLRDIWKAAQSFAVDCYALSERILVQMLYSGSYVGEKMDIFHYYLSQGAKPEVEEAFLTQCAYDFFVRERLTEKTVFEEIGRLYSRTESVQRVCKLAVLKYYAENRSELTEDMTGLVRRFLEEMLDQGIHLEFFREYRDSARAAQELEDKTIIEYRAAPQAKARIHYVILHEDGESGEYTTEAMQEVYDGVFFKEFILFFGETLQYYITEDNGGGEQLTESGTLQKSDIRGREAESRYHLVNDIVISRTLQDYDTMEKLLEEYYRKDFYVSRFFTLK